MGNWLWAGMCIGLALPARADESGGRYQSTVHARPTRDGEASQIVWTGEQLKERGAQNLKDALALIPEIQVRQGGQGTRFDIRGSQPHSILLLVDGVPIDDPYSGAFEISSIPITDIVEIRVELSPASPLEGPGGDGGVIEVFTLRAVGKRLIEGRLTGGSMPNGEAAVTGRSLLRPGLGLRLSLGAHAADPHYPIASGGEFGDRDRQVYTGARFERVGPRGRFAIDIWYGRRAYFIPPSDATGAILLDVTRQDLARAVMGGELAIGKFRLALGTYGTLVSQSTDGYTDFSLRTADSRQELWAGLAGGAAQLERPFSRGALDGRFSARLSVDSEYASVRRTSFAGTWGFVSYGELAVGTHLRYRWLGVEAAVGGLVPFSSPAQSWPEAKLVLRAKPHRNFDILLTGARKGRLPTLRELYDPLQGNAKLDPEIAWHGELALKARFGTMLAARLTGYLRRVDGAIRLSGAMSSRNVNLDTIDVRGVEAGLDVARDRLLGGGLTYLYQDASSKTLGPEPINNFPHHRIDAYLSSTFAQRRGGALARLQWVTSRYVQGTSLPAYTLVEIDAWVRLTEKLRGTVRVDNVTNNDYELLPGLRALGTTLTATLDGIWD